MNFKTVSLVLLLFLIGQAFAEEPQILGKENPPIPAGCSDIGNGIASNNTAENADTIGWKKLFCKSESGSFINVFWLQKRINEKKRIWKVIDVLSIPNQPDRGLMVPFEDSCFYSGKPGYVIAIGEWVKQKSGNHVAVIHEAWLMPYNPEDEKRFLPVSASKIECTYYDHKKKGTRLDSFYLSQ